MDHISVEQARARVDALRACFRRLQRELAEVVLGQDAVVSQLCAGLVCGGHMLLVGVPGLAKTLMVRALAETLGWRFGRIQFTPDLMPSDITGAEILRESPEGGREMAFRPGPVFANLLLADEINRTPPKTQAALLEAMQEYAVTAGGKTHALPRPFVVVATQNPIEQEGTYPLPEAQLDRFMLSLRIDYPDFDHEVAIAARPPRFVLPARDEGVAAEDFEAFRTIVERAPVADRVARYAVALCRATRPTPAGARKASGATAAFVDAYVAWGAGPRASQYLLLAAKAAALLDGRAAPELEDVRTMAPPVLRHRVIANYNALGEGLDADAIVRRLVETVVEVNP